MVKRGLYKVPNGKLLKIFLEEHEGKIVALRITGDFFLYPEENIEQLEQALIGLPLEPETLRAKLEEFLKATPTQFFGLDAPSLVQTIVQAK